MQFAGIILSAVDLSQPEEGVWSARVRLAEDTTLAIGQRGALELGGLALQGVVVDGAVHVGRAEYLLVAGAGGWRTAVPERWYRTDGGVQLAQVARDLASSVGETIEVSQDRALGYAWIRAAGLASDALDQLGAWYVRADGVTVLGTRPAGQVTAEELAVQSFDPARRTAVLGLPDEELGQLVPGLSLTADGVEGLRLEHVRIVAAPGRVFVEAGAHPERRLVDAVLDRVAARQRYLGVWPYQVQEQAGTRLTLRAEPLTVGAGLPSMPSIDVAHGHGGAGETLAVGTVVLLAFQGGDPASPVVVSVVRGPRPPRATLDATEVLIGADTHRQVARLNDTVRVDVQLPPSPAVQGGGILYNPGTQSLQVVPPGTPNAVYLSGAITSASDVLKTK